MTKAGGVGRSIVSETQNSQLRLKDARLVVKLQRRLIHYASSWEARKRWHIDSLFGAIYIVNRSASSDRILFSLLNIHDMIFA